MLALIYRGQTIANREGLFNTFITEQLSQGKTTPTDQAALQWLAQKLETRSRTFRLLTNYRPPGCLLRGGCCIDCWWWCF